MKRSLWGAVVLASFSAVHASAQYVGHYRGCGFWYDEWGNPVPDAVARRIDAETDIMINNYINECRASVLKDYIARNRAHKQLTKEYQDATLNRLREKPEPADVDRGSALNVIMMDLLNPRGSMSELRSITVELDVRTIQQIPFKLSGKRANILVSLRRLHVKNGDWPLLLNGDDFKRDREVYVASVERALEQNFRIEGLKPETINDVSRAVKAIEDRVSVVIAQKPALDRQTRRVEAKQFLDRLKNAAEILERKDVTDLLADLDRFSGTTVADLLEFMRYYRLNFGPAESPEEKKIYVALFDRLKDQRQKYAMRRPDLFPDAVPWQPDPVEGPRIIPTR